MIRMAVLALAVWASLPAGVCQALCAPGDVVALPACHADKTPEGTPTPTDHASDCSRCDHVIATANATPETPVAPPLLAFGLETPSIVGAPGLEASATGAGPPGSANAPYRTANPPLLS